MLIVILLGAITVQVYPMIFGLLCVQEQANEKI